MGIVEQITEEVFIKKSYTQKRKLVSKYLLIKENCRKDIKVICFENKSIHDNFYFNGFKHNIKPVEITIGKIYIVLDTNYDQIKIENDSGKKLWYTMNRFLYSLKLERKEKITKLNGVTTF
jgi:hypothetical protein